MTTCSEVLFCPKVYSRVWRRQLERRLVRRFTELAIDVVTAFDLGGFNWEAHFQRKSGSLCWLLEVVVWGGMAARGGMPLLICVQRK